METTIGQLLINDALPEDLRDYKRSFGKKSVKEFFEEVAAKHPEQYAEISDRVHRLASSISTFHGRNASLSLAAFKTPDSVRKLHKEIEAKVQKILAGPGTTDAKHDKIVETVSDYLDPVTDANLAAGIAENNPLAMQVTSGSRGSNVQFRKLRGGSLLVTDHKDRPVPIPILSSLADGLDPVQYYAAAFGARRGEAVKKMATPKSGYLGKQMAAASHKIVVTEKDCGTANGIQVPAADLDSIGAVLAADVGKFKAGEVLTSRHLKALDDKTIMVRSPLTCQAEHGICSQCAGKRESGFPPIGSNLGLPAGQSVAEPLTQSLMQVRHLGGAMQKKRVTKTKSGLDLINQLVQVPESFPGGAAIANSEGRIDDIEDAPQGGKFVSIAGKQHWVPEDQEVLVQKGDNVEAGDVLSSGIPNPAEIVRHKGIGEGRRQFVDIFRKTLADAGQPAHRRNLEILARGLINHVRVTDLDGPADTVPDDVTEYDNIVRGYQPRYGAQSVTPKAAVGMYLEKPVMHYSIGTKVTPRVAKNLGDTKITNVLAHPDKPPFVPEMQRAMETLAHSDDWMVRMAGLYGTKRSTLQAVHRGGESSEHSLSYIPGLAKGVDFGKGPPEAIY